MRVRTAFEVTNAFDENLPFHIRGLARRSENPMEKGKQEHTPLAHKSTRPCPSSGRGGHRDDEGQESCLTRQEIREQLASLPLGPGSFLMRQARYRATYADLDCDDLLQEALLRALTTRTCPRHVPVERFVAAIMRSIASKAVERKERTIMLGLYGDDFVYHAEELIAGSPVDQIEYDERRMHFARLLALVTEADPLAECVIDGIDDGLRGADLADHASINQKQLATVRRRIKRRVQELFEGGRDVIMAV